MSNLPMILFLLPFVAALVCGIAGMRWPAVARWTAAGAMLLTAALSFWVAARVMAEGALSSHLGGWAPPIGIEWSLDPVSALMVAMIACVGAAAMLGTLTTIRPQQGGSETFFHACSLLMISGLMGMAMTADLFNLFVHLEVASLSAYALVAAGRRKAPRAAMDYLVLGSIGASLYLLGVGFLYAATGSLNMTDVAQRLAAADGRLALTGIILIIAGLGVKMGLFPLHGWLPSAYALAPAAATALMAPLATKVCAYALLRVMFWVFRPEYLQQQQMLLSLLCWAGAIAMVFGALKAAAQNDLWRLLAYSSISQMGLVALGAGLANSAGLTGALLHLVNDALMKGALFLAAGVVLLRFNIRLVSDLPRLRGRAPWTAALFTVVGFSLIGIPPLCGFYGKWYVLSGTIQAGAWVFAAAIILGTLATAIYVFRLLEQLFFASAPETGSMPAPVRGSLAMSGAGLALGAAVVLVGLTSERIVTMMIVPALSKVGL
jgi:multicomponent Na+:H+ antiporter subunit D